MSAVSATTARANLYHIIDQVILQHCYYLIQETLHLTSIPGMTRSIREARADGLDGACEELDW